MKLWYSATSPYVRKVRAVAALTAAEDMEGFAALCAWADRMNALYPCLAETKPQA